MDALFKIGTGYLGWTPDVTLNTPIPQIILALEGKMDFAQKTNPFGSTAKKKEKAAPDQNALGRQRSRLAMMKFEARRSKRERG